VPSLPGGDRAQSLELLCRARAAHLPAVLLRVSAQDVRGGDHQAHGQAAVPNVPPVGSAPLHELALRVSRCLCDADALREGPGIDPHPVLLPPPTPTPPPGCRLPSAAASLAHSSTTSGCRSAEKSGCATRMASARKLHSCARTASPLLTPTPLSSGCSSPSWCGRIGGCGCARARERSCSPRMHASYSHTNTSCLAGLLRVYHYRRPPPPARREPA